MVSPDGALKVLDLGLAKLLQDGSTEISSFRLAQTGRVEVRVQTRPAASAVFAWRRGATPRRVTLFTLPPPSAADSHIIMPLV